MTTEREVLKDEKSRQQQEHQRWRKISNQLFPSISWVELTFYFVFFWGGCFYSLYRFYRTSQRWAQYLPVTPTPDSWFGPQQDKTDLEWLVWLPLLVSWAPWGLLHVALSQLVRKMWPQHLCSFYIGFSLCVCVAVIGSVGTVLCLLVPSIMFLVLATRLKLLVWLAWSLILILFNTHLFTVYLEYWVEEIPDGDYKVSVIMAWIILRSLSFSLEICDQDPDARRSPLPLLLTLFGYCLYLPFLCTGPYMPYSDFEAGLAEPYRTWSLRQVGWVCGQLIRFLWWMGFTQFLLCQFYAHSLQFTPELVRKMTSWSLAGFVYFLAAFLQLKYVVLYGLPSVLARAEGYLPPRHPRCTLMTYRFSDVWRYFDQGLYRFMLRYIYVPWVGEDNSVGRQLQGTILVFTFVYVWHGVSSQVLWWAIINCMGVVTEKLADIVARSDLYRRWEARWLPGAWSRRWHGLLAVCLYVPSLTALTIFLSNIDNAMTVGKRIFITGFPQSTLAMFWFMYCLGQVSMELHNWKIRHKLQKELPSTPSQLNTLLPHHSFPSSPSQLSFFPITAFLLPHHSFPSSPSQLPFPSPSQLPFPSPSQLNSLLPHHSFPLPHHSLIPFFPITAFLLPHHSFPSSPSQLSFFPITAFLLPHHSFPSSPSQLPFPSPSQLPFPSPSQLNSLLPHHSFPLPHHSLIPFFPITAFLLPHHSFPSSPSQHSLFPITASPLPHHSFPSLPHHSFPSLPHHSLIPFFPITASLLPHHSFPSLLPHHSFPSSPSQLSFPSPSQLPFFPITASLLPHHSFPSSPSQLSFFSITASLLPHHSFPSSPSQLSFFSITASLLPHHSLIPFFPITAFLPFFPITGSLLPHHSFPFFPITASLLPHHSFPSSPSQLSLFPITA
ncbi:hypothetical protein Pcinc_018982 [Petrolisthes cinctipes]|uniref:Protein-cysteine N-palmitoyltransferase Rasp n=1 Tax=Petrolisthes cinctipes TaxID=88211 RepID=A0AAE1KM42_PETCI|nr:hypothetical protein Pcinc_018982 [Petrolisthes cinctipes]